MQLKIGSATVPVASSRRPADWRSMQNDSHFSEPPQESNAFGETPKAAGGDARASQSFCMDTAQREAADSREGPGNAAKAAAYLPPVRLMQAGGALEEQLCHDEIEGWTLKCVSLGGVPQVG